MTAQEQGPTQTSVSLGGTRSDLHLLVGPAGELKIGTCEHCVIREPGRPDRAWNPNGDAELDFDRDRLLTELAQLGVQAHITEEYVCP